jgi:hypothetical protein
MRRVRLAAFAIVSLLASATHAADKDADVCADLSEKGQLLKIKGKLREARDTFLECVKDKCPPLVRKDCGQFLVDLETAMPTIVVAAREPSGADLTDVRVIIDGEVLTTRLEGKALPMDPGVHKFRFEAKGRVTVDQTIVVREGERNRVISVTLAPEADTTVPPKPTPIEPGPPVAAWIATGISVVGFGTFAAFGLSARAEFNDLEKRCGSRCAEKDVDRVRARALVADIGLAVGVLGAGAATYFFIDHAKKSSVQLGAGWIGITATF